MSFRKMMAQRFYTSVKIRRTSWRAATLDAWTTQEKTSPDPGEDKIFRRYLHRDAEARPWPFLPAGEKLLQGMDTAASDRRLSPPPEAVVEECLEGKMTSADVKKIHKLKQLEMVKSKVRQNGNDCVSYSDFLEICVRESSSKDEGLEFAKILDESGAVLVVGNTVCVSPEKVIKAIQDVLMPIAFNEATKKDLEEMEIQKAAIDKKAELHVHRELWSGLGFLIVHSLLFMRLTFWELSWDVMEPICFFVTSVFFMGGYAFFLRTSKEPSFEGFYASRLRARRRRLIKATNFNVERYIVLKREYCSFNRW